MAALNMHVLFLFLPFLFDGINGQTDRRIPLGAIFDLEGKETRGAFSYGVMDNNADNTRSIKLDANSQKTQTNDSFSLSTTICSLMSNGIFALFGTHNMRTINTARSFTKTFNMPYITPSIAVNSSDGNSAYMLYMRPLYTQAVIDIIKHYRWTIIYYVYDSEDGLIRLQQLFDFIVTSNIDVEVKVVEVSSDPDEIYNQLRTIDMTYEKGNKPVLLDLPNDVSEVVLKKQDRDTWRVSFHYVLIGLGAMELDLSLYANGGINVTGFQMVDFSNSSHKSFFDHWSRTDGASNRKITYEAALAVDSVRLIAQGLQRLIKNNPKIYRDTLNRRRGRFYNNDTEGIDCDSDPVKPWFWGKEIMKMFRRQEFYGLTGRIAFDDFGLRRGYHLSVLEVSFARRMQTIGVWTPERGFHHQSPKIIRDKGIGPISQKTRIVTSILTEPFLIQKALNMTPDDGTPPHGNERFEGYCADLTKKVAEIVKIDYLIVPVKDAKYGSPDENGTWNGMVGELVRKEADMAVAPLTITSVRERVIDFSKPFMSLGISIMIKKQTKAPPGVFSFMFPLSYEIWMCVIFAYIGVSVVLFLVSRFSPFEWHIEDNSEGPTVTNNFTIFNSLWFSLGAFMQQGCDIEPRSLSGRIVGSVWWFFTLIVISSYTANLAAFLTVERMQSPIESADDLAKQTEIKYGTVEGGSTMGFFQASTIPVFERMWAFMSSAEPTVFMTSNEKGVQRVRDSNGRYAFLVESTTNDYINERKPCDTMKVGSNLDSKGYGIGTPLGSDLRDRITLAVLELRENGELQKLEKKWWYEKGECDSGKGGAKKKKEATSALKLLNVAGIFYILIGGLILAIIMAALEFLYKTRKDARRRKTSFGNAVMSKARLSIKGTPDPSPPATGHHSDSMPSNMSMSTMIQLYVPNHSS